METAPVEQPTTQESVVEVPKEAEVVVIVEMPLSTPEEVVIQEPIIAAEIAPIDVVVSPQPQQPTEAEPVVVVAAAAAAAVEEDVTLEAPSAKRQKMTPKSKVIKYFTEANRHTCESEYISWRKFNNEVRDADGFLIAGAIEFLQCRLLKTLDPDDPHMIAGKKIARVRFIPCIMTMVFYPGKDLRLVRIFKFKSNEIEPVILA